MVKRQKERQYQSSVEHRLTSQFRSGRSSGNNNPRPLPFDCCALTLTPFTNPVCCIVQSDSNGNGSNNKGNDINQLNKKKVNHGIIFENSEIMPYLLKHKSNPLTGKPMSSQNLITLSIDSSTDGDNNKKTWQCPIMNKPFLNHTKIVAVKIKGTNRANVYSYEAYQTLNVKNKNYIDLIDGTKFHPTKDVIVLNDVDDGALAKLRDINNFVHLDTLRKNHQQNGGSGQDGAGGGVNLSVSAKRIMDKLQSKQKKQKEEEEKIKKRKQQEENEKNDDTGKDDYKKMKILTSDLGITYTKGRASGSLTSTALPSASLSSTSDIREATEEEILTSLFDTMKKRKQKAFVRMYTNFGNMDIELQADIAPRTCMNFIGLVEKKWYDGTSFHRLIRNFMIQGGGSRTSSTKKKKRKTLNGSEGGNDKEQSIWGRPFQDEFDQRLKHVGPGVVSMANAGKDTNKCQFFITFKSAPHLDNKHSVFGKVVKGLNVLADLENVPCDKTNNRPLEDVYIEKMILFGDNPVADAEEIEKKKILKRIQEREKLSLERKESALGKSKERVSSTVSAGTKLSPSEKDVPKVGRYLQKKKKKKSQSDHGESAKKEDSSNDDVGNSFAIPSRLPAAPKKTTFGDFSGW
mmetsp:Transcript_21873/g.32743  ORF Transcript_21873/g.32743 Transcript_21873/m.32743 type:complete len:632 (-) Transcript_21873:104-1999(-)